MTMTDGDGLYIIILYKYMHAGVLSPRWTNFLCEDRFVNNNNNSNYGITNCNDKYVLLFITRAWTYMH